MKCTFRVLALIPLCLAACDAPKSQDRTVRRDGQPDMTYVSKEDPEMVKAIQTARSTLDQFAAAVSAPKAGQESFACKKPFTEGDTVEHMWITDVSFDGARFRGTVNNEPVEVKNVKLGQKTEVPRNEVSDWMYLENGKLVGGYTLRVLRSRMSPGERKDFDENCGFKFE